jgi:hypothetical protein
VPESVRQPPAGERTDERAAPNHAPSPQAPVAAQMLALQRSAGNRAVAQMVAREPASFWQRVKKTFGSSWIEEIGGEQVLVKSKSEVTDAKRIVKELPEKYGVDVSSARSMKALESRTKSAPVDLIKKIKTWPWLYKELKAIERALTHFAPILGTARKSSTRKDVDQEILSVGKMESKLKNIKGTWQFSESVIGEYFSEHELRAFTMYKHGEDATPDFADIDKQLEATATHEIAHGIFTAYYDRWVTQFPYWLDQDTKSGKAGEEAPPTDYGTTNAREDLAESVMLYFCDRKQLREGKGGTAGAAGNPCPLREAFISTLVGEWTPKPPVGDFPEPDKTVVIA